MNVVGEAIIVGIICVAVGSVVFAGVEVLESRTDQYNTRAPKRPMQWELLSLFLTGFLGHLFFEYTGMNERLHRWTGVWLW